MSSRGDGLRRLDSRMNRAENDSTEGPMKIEIVYCTE